MKAFLIFYLILAALGIVARLFLLAVSDYPRWSQRTPASDVGGLLFTAAVGAWALALYLSI